MTKINTELKDKFQKQTLIEKINLPENNEINCFKCGSKLQIYTQDKKNYVCNTCVLLYSGMNLEMVREITKLRNQLKKNNIKKAKRK